jgi:hypothetical protein
LTNKFRSFRKLREKEENKPFFKFKNKLSFDITGCNKLVTDNLYIRIIILKQYLDSLNNLNLDYTQNDELANNNRLNQYGLEINKFRLEILTLIIDMQKLIKNTSKNNNKCLTHCKGIGIKCKINRLIKRFNLYQTKFNNDFKKQIEDYNNRKIEEPSSEEINKKIEDIIEQIKKLEQEKKELLNKLNPSDQRFGGKKKRIILDKCDLKKLKEIAKQRNIKNISKLKTKSELIQAIRNKKK